MRIVSLVPSHTEILFALGMEEQVAGVTANCDYPPKVMQKLKVGTFAYPDTAEIVALNPDLVVAGGGIHASCVIELRRAGIEVLDFLPQSVNGLLKFMEQIVELTGENRVGGPAVAMFKDKLSAIKEKTKHSARPRVMFIMGKNRLAIPGPATCQYDALRIAGADPVSIGEDAACAITWEDIVDEDPDIILACGRSENQPLKERCPGCTLENRPCVQNAAEIFQHPFLRKVAAIKTSRVHAVPCHYLCRPGPRLFDGMMDLTRLFFS